MSLLIRSDDDCLRAIRESNMRLGRSQDMKPLGCEPRFSKYGRAPGAIRSCVIYKRIPRNEWPRLIREGLGNWLSDIRGRRLKPHDQGSTPLCWAHGSVRAVEVLRLVEGQQPLLLSAEQLAYVATGGRMARRHAR